MSGKKNDHTINNVLLGNALRLILLLSDTSGGAVHEKPIADGTPSPYRPRAGCDRLSASSRARSLR